MSSAVSVSRSGRTSVCAAGERELHSNHGSHGSHEPQRHGNGPRPSQHQHHHRTQPRRGRRRPRRPQHGDDLLLWLPERGATVCPAGHQLTWRDVWGLRRSVPIGRSLRGPEDRQGDSAAPQPGERPLQLHASTWSRRHHADGDAQDGGAADAKPRPLPADGAARRPGGGELRPDARLHDLQRLPVHRRGGRRWHGLLPVQLAEGGGGGHHGALPLAPLPR